MRSINRPNASSRLQLNQTYLAQRSRRIHIPLQALQYAAGVSQVGARRVAAAAGCRTLCCWNAGCAACILGDKGMRPRLIVVHSVFAVVQCRVQRNWRSFHHDRGAFGGQNGERGG